MTRSTVTLRIQELAEAKGLTLEEISKASGVSVQAIQAYTNTPVELTESIAADLRKIATQLNVPVIELVKPLTERGAFRLNILEKLKQKGLTLEELSAQSGIHPAIVAYYSTQPICQRKLNEFESKNKYLSRISKVLDCCIDDLKVKAELPLIKFCLEEWVEKNGLNLEDMSIFTGLPIDFIDLISTQPIETSVDAIQIDIEANPPETTPKEIICRWIETVLGKQQVCE